MPQDYWFQILSEENKRRMTRKVFIFVCMCILHVWLWTMCVTCAYWDQKRTQHPLGLELQKVVSHHVCIGNQPWSLKRTTSALNHWAFSLDPGRSFLKQSLICFSLLLPLSLLDLPWRCKLLNESFLENVTIFNLEGKGDLFLTVVFCK